MRVSREQFDMIREVLSLLREKLPGDTEYKLVLSPIWAIERPPPEPHEFTRHISINGCVLEVEEKK